MTVDRIKEYLYAKPGIIFAYVFGSFGKPQFKEGRSDIDLAIFGDHVFTFHELADMSDDLQRLLPGHPEIDLVDLNQDAIILHQEIVRNGQLLFTRDQNVLDLFLMTQWSKYLDFKEYMKRFDEDLKKRVLK
jgi:predicted nucleotidyltransferase